MIDTLESWSKRDLLALIMIYASNADLTVTEEEQNLVKRKIGFDHFKTAHAFFESNSDYETLQAILQLKDRFYPGERGKEAIMEYLEELFDSDSEYTGHEQIFQRYLSRLLD
ncbi:hypothetical protein GCM10023189_39890 [Nibrella saemangeumensis]|uniref:TerB family tellurite resistance protein n=1 Tax=Nibrella saemangeumensis TaxID=1084526 RepID=A0ABP8NBD0_9BACT